MPHFLLRSLIHYWRTHLFILFGLAVATAVMLGSLVVGDSMAGSLRDNALAHLGEIDHVLIAPHFFSASLAEDVGRGRGVPAFSVVSPAILLRGSVAVPEGDLRIANVTVVGIDASFYAMFRSRLPEGAGRSVMQMAPEAGGCVINQAVADDLHLRVHDDLLLTLDRPSALSDNLIFAHRRRDETLRTLRLTISEIAREPMGGFALGSQSTAPRNIFVSRDALAVALEQPHSANVLLAKAPGMADSRPLQNALAGHVALADHGLSLVSSDAGQCVWLQSASLLLTPAQLTAARQAAEDVHASVAPASVYLATRIAKTGAEGGKSIAYAMVAGMGDSVPAWSVSAGAVPSKAGQIALNSWAGEDLGARPGDQVELTFLLPTTEGTYRNATRSYTVSGIVALAGPAADPHWTPSLHGMTDAKHIDQWKLPFPVDSSRLTPRDDEYWDHYTTTPKAFLTLADLQAIWAAATPANAPTHGGPFVTSVRLVPPATMPLEQFQRDYAGALLKRLTPEQSGMVFRPIRQQITAASAGSTDFGRLFLALSFFLIIAAAALSGMFMRLLLEQRAAEIGLLLAAGFSPGRVARLALSEGFVLVMLATVIGLPAGILYNRFIIHAMNHWWSGPWQTAHLTTHLVPTTVLIGAVSGVFLGLACMVWALWSLRRLPVLRLLSGRQAVVVLAPGKRRVWPFVVPAALGAGALAFLVAAARRGGGVSPELAFFCSGFLLLAAALCFLWIFFRWILQSAGPTISLVRLALRNAAANRARSLLVVGLLASACFLIVAVAANHRDYSTLDPSDRASPTGGFALRGTTSSPLHLDLSSAVGRSRLGLPPSAESAFSHATVIPMAQSPGEDISCLNLATPLRPRLLGVTPALTSLHPFAITTASAAPANPWQLLDAPDPDGAIPAFGDADSLEWTLHTALGEILTFPGPSGEPVKLRIVGTIPGSIFAGELLISDAHLHQVYPNLSGSTYFLVAAPPQDQPILADALRSGLADFGLELRTTPEILNAFVSIQNIYLSICMTLGALGLLLGSAGMIAVMARNVLERRSELALLSAAGFSRGRLVHLLLVENGSLVLLGLAAGTISALLAVAPSLGSAQNTVPWNALAAILVSVTALGLGCCIITAWLSIGPSPIKALREE